MEVVILVGAIGEGVSVVLGGEEIVSEVVVCEVYVFVDGGGKVVDIVIVIEDKVLVVVVVVVTVVIVAPVDDIEDVLMLATVEQTMDIDPGCRTALSLSLDCPELILGFEELLDKTIGL